MASGRSWDYAYDLAIALIEAELASPSVPFSVFLVQ
jgi:hypothetical protein